MRPDQVGLVFEEVHLKRFFKHFAVDCVFDVGANKGQYRDMLRTRVGYTGPVISFEPIPELATELRARAAETSNWYIEEVALDEKVGVRPFNIMAGDQFSSLREPSHEDVDIFRDTNEIVRIVEVEVSTLAVHYAKYFDKLGFRNAFLKLDTQGNDLRAVEGAGDAISNFIGLQSELSIRRIYDQTSDIHAALPFYQSKGFELSALVPNNAGHFPRLIEIDCIMFRSDAIAGMQPD